MIHYPRYCMLLLLSASYSSFALNIIVKQDLWQCTLQDSTKKEWVAQNAFQKIAFNKTLDLCKKESKQPANCTSEVVKCEQLIMGSRNKPAWKCTALDMNAEAWRSNEHPGRIEAAFAAKGYCRHKSLVPDTCYVNMVTCVNKGARE